MNDANVIILFELCLKYVNVGLNIFLNTSPKFYAVY